ncbi:hypothetical protein [Novosphingobium sp.]|uniref:hypothetical protein n=1 Tax=Novosphingobium sp. TaxID=1874826 RepID=UPI0035B4DB52
MVRSKLFTRSALGVALALGVAAGALTAPVSAFAKDKKEKAPEAPKISPSKAFIPAYQAAVGGIEKASKNADITAARTNVTNAENAYRAAKGKDARAQAKTNLDNAYAALGNALTAEKALLEQAFTVVSNADDKYLAGQLALNLGNIALDKPMQRRGLQAMVDSGKTSPAETAKFNFYIGGISFDMKDYPAARTALEAAIAGGYTEGDPEYLLAESYIGDNQAPAGLKVLLDASDKKGAGVSEDWLRRGIVVAYKINNLEYAGAFSSRLVSLYPNNENWALAIAVQRDLGKYQSQDLIDLMRLMERTKSFSEERDFVEYIQAADPRRLPGEVLKVIEEGLAAGKLNPSDPFVVDAKSNASGRISADKASFPGLEKDARAANATAATAMAAGDTFLSYDMPAKAIDMYQIALTKPGVDSPRVLTRLGIAQADAGLYADAQATFAKVDGVRKPIADLWSVYAKNKAAGK